MSLRIIVPSLGRGGAEQFSVQLLRSMSDHQKKVHMTVLTGLRREIETDGLPVSIFPHNKARQSFLNLLMLRLKNPSEIWLSTGLQANIICLLVSLITFSLSKLIIRMNNPLEHDLYLFNSKANQIFFQICFRYVRCVVYQSESMADSYQEVLTATNYTVIPNYTDFQYCTQNAVDCTRIRFINVSRFVDQKDHPFLLKLAKKLLAAKIDFSFDLYGDGPTLRHFENSLAEAKLTGYFKLHGSCPRNKIVFDKDYIYIQQSKFEGFPNSIVEALNTGVLVYDFTDNFYSSELAKHPNYYKFFKQSFTLTDVVTPRIPEVTPLTVGSNSLLRYEALC